MHLADYFARILSMHIDLIVYTLLLEIVNLVGSFFFVKHQSSAPKSANFGAESRNRTLSTPHIIALYESFVVRNGSTDPDLRLRFGHVQMIFFLLLLFSLPHKGVAQRE